MSYCQVFLIHYWLMISLYISLSHLGTYSNIISTNQTSWNENKPNESIRFRLDWICDRALPEHEQQLKIFHLLFYHFRQNKTFNQINIWNRIKSYTANEKKNNVRMQIVYKISCECNFDSNCADQPITCGKVLSFISYFSLVCIEFHRIIGFWFLFEFLLLCSHSVYLSFHYFNWLSSFEFMSLHANTIIITMEASFDW